jgi:DinB family protein
MTLSTAVDSQRFPIGPFSRPASSMAGIRAAHIHTLKLLPERLRAAVDGLDDSQLDTPYRDGGWTVRQVVHHVADSHANAYVRMKLALTEDWPTIKPYDEAAWADLSDARWLPVGISLDMITALHARWVSLLESLADADFQKGYVHPESGRQTLAQVLAMYDWHSRHHTAHITSLRARMGW